jgi:hypothetical protein
VTRDGEEAIRVIIIVVVRRRILCYERKLLI